MTDRSPYNGKEGMKRGQREIRDFVKKHRRMPKTKEMQALYLKIHHGEYASHDPLITSWSDMLASSGVGYIKRNKKRELDIYKKEITKLAKKLGKTPTMKELSKAKVLSRSLSSIFEGTYKTYGITSYNDLLNYSGLELNNRWDIYNGKSSHQIKVEILEKMKQNGDEEIDLAGFEILNKAIKAGKIKNTTASDLREFCILNNIPQKTERRGYWETEEALEMVVDKLQMFYNIHGKRPSLREVRTICRSGQSTIQFKKVSGYIKVLKVLLIYMSMLIFQVDSLVLSTGTIKNQLLK